MKAKNFEHIPTVFEDDNKEVGKFTELYTDVGNFTILKPLDEVLEELKEIGDGLFRYEKLDEYSQVIEHFGALVLDLSKVKILGYKEHRIVHDRVKQKEIDDAGLSVKE